MNDYYSLKELKKIGFKKIGKKVLISKKASFYNPQLISLGNNVRIDAYCLLSGRIVIGDNVHLSASVLLFSSVDSSQIIINDYCCISSRSALYSISDDYSGNFLVGPLVDKKKRNVIGSDIIVNKYVVIGTGSTVLPGVNIAEGCAFGAMCLISKNTDPWYIYLGIPCKKYKKRSKKMLALIK